MKNYDDRQFCNGHRTVTVGMPVAYLISGNYSGEYNLQTLVEARSQVGGTKIFRDLIYVMQGFMKADHKYYKEHGIYDFPQKQKGTILKMKLAGALLSVPSVQKKMKGKLGNMIVGPYQKVIEEAQPEKMS